ncbi:MAG TPA: MarR family winged helix-turn-helix transcriptional regulator [Steroidobacteraceae bacterium]
MPTSVRTALQLEGFLPYRLSVLSNTISAAIAGAYQQRFGLSTPQWRVLCILALTPELSAAEVARRTAMDKVAVSRAVGALLRSHRVQRRTASHDRRTSALRLSSAGRRLYAQVAPFALTYEQELIEPLAAHDRLTLDRLLRTLLGRAIALGPAGRPHRAAVAPRV